MNKPNDDCDGLIPYIPLLLLLLSSPLLVSLSIPAVDDSISASVTVNDKFDATVGVSAETTKSLKPERHWDIDDIDACDDMVTDDGNDDDGISMYDDTTCDDDCISNEFDDVNDGTIEVTNTRVHDVAGGTVNDTEAAPFPFAYRVHPLTNDHTLEPSNATHSTLFEYIIS